MSTEPGRARYVFRLPAPLPASLAEDLVGSPPGSGGIPGVRYWSNARGLSLTAPIDAGWIVEAALQAAGVVYSLVAPKLAREPFPPSAGAAVAALDARLATTGDLSSGIRAANTDYQTAGVAFAAWVEDAAIWHPPGAGKTREAIEWALSVAGPVIVATPATVRGSWWRQATQCFTGRVHAIDPHIYARVNAERLDGYLARCAADAQRPFVIVAHEGLADWIDALCEIKPMSVVLDELHRLSQPKRMRWTVGEADPATGEARLQAHGLRNTAHAAWRLSHAARRRLGTTATPISDRLRHLWATLDLLRPGSMGTVSCFRKRYCGAAPGLHGGLEDTGRTNIEELRRRLSFYTHRVSYAVTHAQLPAKRRITTILPPERQDRAGPGFAAAIRAALHGEEGDYLDVRLMEAASRKRSYVIETACDTLAGGGKVVILTGRQEDCEKLYAALATATARRAIRAPVRWAHGGVAAHTRDQLREAYMADQGASALVGTNDSMGIGVDLQDTDHAICAMLPWNPTRLWQLENRFSRMGQRRPVLVEYVIAEGTVDEHVADIVLRKLADVEAVAPDAALEGVGQSLRGLDDAPAVLAALVERMRADDAARAAEAEAEAEAADAARAAEADEASDSSAVGA